MKWLKRKLDDLAVAAIVLLFGALFGQFPQYLAQYLQRLGGHIDEAQMVVEKYKVEELEDRLHLLKVSFQQINDAEGISKLFSFVKYMEKDIARQTMDYFTPGITFDYEGMMFLLFGALLGFILYELFKDSFLYVSRRARRKRNMPGSLGQSV